jgi:hypothetical protein
MATKSKDAIDRVRAAVAAARDIHDIDADLRARHRARSKERAQTDLALPPLQDVIAGMERLIDDAAAEWAKDFGAIVARACGGHVEMDSDGRGNEVRRERRPQLPIFTGDRLDLKMLAALAPDALKASLAAAIRGSRVTFGLPAEARAARLAELDAEIAELEREHTALVDAAAEAGITLVLLPTVLKRREDAARAAERDAELAQLRSTLHGPLTLQGALPGQNGPR